MALVCGPDDASRDASFQAEESYRALGERLTAEGCGRRDLVSEVLFLRDLRRDLPAVLAARSQVLAEAGQGDAGPAPAIIQQAPLTPGSTLLVAAAAVVPKARERWSVRDVAAASGCPCDGCARSAARLVQLGEQVSLFTSNLHGRGGDAFAEVFDMFVAGERLLERCGLTFHDVVRTWIHLRDIDRDYDMLNRARREFFLSRDIEPRPASTGVQGGPAPAAHDFSLRLEAVRSPRLSGPTPISTPTLNEAWSYGADFSRGLRVVEANKVTLHVSGTASLDEAGRTVHAGDLAGQVERMLRNIATLLDGQGATFADLVSGVVYLKRPSDAPLLRDLCRRHGFDGFPCALVEAPLCRPELLCEAEAVAMLPLNACAA